MPWLSVQVDLEHDEAEQAEALLLLLGAVSVTFEDLEDKPILEPSPGETPLWPNIKATALFTHDTDTDALKRALANILPDRKVVTAQLADQVWERAWMDDFHPMQFGRRVWIVPSWSTPPDPDACNIFLDPGLAFGTGTHPTTALCLAWLDGADLRDKVVIDYGCGSGILAIAAEKLGAREVWAVDIDPQAITATAENAKRNDCTRIRVGIPDDIGDVRADVLLANILAEPLLALQGRFSELTVPNADYCLSGILEEQAKALRTAYMQSLDGVQTAMTDGWTRISGTRKP